MFGLDSMDGGVISTAGISLLRVCMDISVGVMVSVRVFFEQKDGYQVTLADSYRGHLEQNLRS